MRRGHAARNPRSGPALRRPRGRFSRRRGGTGGSSASPLSLITGEPMVPPCAPSFDITRASRGWLHQAKPGSAGESAGRPQPTCAAAVHLRRTLSLTVAGLPSRVIMPRKTGRTRDGLRPLPFLDLGHIVPVHPRVLLVLDELVAELLLHI